MDSPRLAIVVPAYCEANTIAKVVMGAKAHGVVLVVDDCSDDDTGARAADAGALVVRNDTNLGYDGALHRGFEEAADRGFECIITLDADGEHDPELVARFSHLLLEKDIPLVLGVREYKQRFSEILMGLYVKIRFGVDDILCGMKGYHTSLLLANGGFDHSGSIGTELAINSIRRGCAFEQIQVRGEPRMDRPRFAQTLKANRLILRALWLVMRDDLSAFFSTKNERVT